MAKEQRYWPMALSGVCLAVALYYSVTDSAYRSEGCPSEVYPEAAFLFIAVPVALLALLLATKIAFTNVGSRSRRSLFTTSVALSSLCLAMTALFLWPTGSNCH